MSEPGFKEEPYPGDEPLRGWILRDSGLQDPNEKRMALDYDAEVLVSHIRRKLLAVYVKLNRELGSPNKAKKAMNTILAHIRSSLPDIASDLSLSMESHVMEICRNVEFLYVTSSSGHPCTRKKSPSKTKRAKVKEVEPTEIQAAKSEV